MFIYCLYIIYMLYMYIIIFFFLYNFTCSYAPRKTSACVPETSYYSCGEEFPPQEISCCSYVYSLRQETSCDPPCRGASVPPQATPPVACDRRPSCVCCAMPRPATACASRLGGKRNHIRLFDT